VPQFCHSPVGAGEGHACRPLPLAPRYPRLPASPACLHILASPTCSYKSTQTQQVARLNAKINRYPNLHRISRFDIWINEKFDINITSCLVTYLLTVVGNC